MSAAIVVRCVRPAWLAGRAFEAGETGKVAPLVAAMAIDSGRFELAYEGDAAEVLKARQADVRRAIAAHGKPWAGPQVAEPWQRIA